VFIAPWLCGAAALLHDGRFDPTERVELLARERVNVLCMAPTEYRVIAKRVTLPPLSALREMVAAGEALDPHVLDAWQEVTKLAIRDGYGQTETGQMTGMPIQGEVRPGSMGLPLAGVRLAVEDGELVTDPTTVPTFFLGYLGEDVRPPEAGAENRGPKRSARQSARSWVVEDRGARGAWHTGDRVHADEDGFLYFEGRADDVIISAGYRIGPFEVESACLEHPAVAEAAAVAVADERRGNVVKAFVVLSAGHEPSDALAEEIKTFVREHLSAYAYPRLIEFVPDLPKTLTGKIRRIELRQREQSGGG
jgi:acyl-coenzyme A synthetase/AMP-(fatty) acid ligase